MLSKNKIKLIHSLQRKKGREDTGLFVVEGNKMAGEALLASPGEIVELFALPGWLEKWHQTLAEKGIAFHEIDARSLGKISNLKTPNQVLFTMRLPATLALPTGLDQQLTLYLDTIQDPGNMGTILRTADWFGISTVICSPTCADVFAHKVVQATMGAIFRINVIVEPLADVVHRFPGIEVYGTLLAGENLYEQHISRPGIIVIGNESRGIDPANRSLITVPIAIPGAPGSRSESLNAAIATGIICAHFRRSIPG